MKAVELTDLNPIHIKSLKWEDLEDSWRARLDEDNYRGLGSGNPEFASGIDAIFLAILKEKPFWFPKSRKMCIVCFYPFANVKLLSGTYIKCYFRESEKRVDLSYRTKESPVLCSHYEPIIMETDGVVQFDELYLYKNFVEHCESKMFS
jgi:hypothetical protein